LPQQKLLQIVYVGHDAKSGRGTKRIDQKKTWVVIPDDFGPKPLQQGFFQK